MAGNVLIPPPQQQQPAAPAAQRPPLVPPPAMPSAARLAAPVPAAPRPVFENGGVRVWAPEEGTTAYPIEIEGRRFTVEAPNLESVRDIATNVSNFVTQQPQPAGSPNWTGPGPAPQVPDETPAGMTPTTTEQDLDAAIADRLNIEFNRRFPAESLAQTLRMLAQGVSFGWSDEIAGWLGGDTEFERRRVEQFREANPTAATLIELVGALPAAAIPILGGARAGSMLLRAGTAGVAAGAQGALYGAGTATEGNRAAGALAAAIPSAALGVAAPVLAPVIARSVSAAYGAIRHPFRGTQAAAPGLVPSARVTQATQFGIPLTRGQATGNLAQQAREQAMINVARGDSAAFRLRTFMDSQNEAIRDAANGIATGLSGMLRRPVATREAGEAATDGVRAIARDLEAEATRNYRTAEVLNPTISRSSAEFVPQNVAWHLVNSNTFLDEALTPSAFAAMAEIDALSSFARQGRVELADIERVRQRMRQIADGADGRDGPAVRTVIRAYDDSIDEMVDNQLFAGDVIAIQALQDARAGWSRLRSMTNPKPNDDAGRVISRMLAQDVTPEEAANWIFGSTQAFPTGRSVRVTETLRDLLGPQSEEWAAIRSAAFTNLITPRTAADAIMSPTMIANNITNFLSGRGQTLSTVMFTPAERDLMRQFANTMRILVPDAVSTNPSKSAYAMTRSLGPILGAIGSQVGLSLGGIPGFIAGAVVPSAARAATNYVQVRRALNPNAAAPLFSNPAAASRAIAVVLQGANAVGTPRLSAAVNE